MKARKLEVKTLRPSITGPYEFDDATGVLSVALIGCAGGPYKVELRNPRETAMRILAACEGRVVAFDRPGVNACREDAMNEADKCPACHHDWHGAALCGERVVVVGRNSDPFVMSLFGAVPNVAVNKMATRAECACRG